MYIAIGKMHFFKRFSCLLIDRQTVIISNFDRVYTNSVNEKELVVNQFYDYCTFFKVDTYVPKSKLKVVDGLECQEQAFKLKQELMNCLSMTSSRVILLRNERKMLPN